MGFDNQMSQADVVVTFDVLLAKYCREAHSERDIKGTGVKVRFKE